MHGRIGSIIEAVQKKILICKTRKEEKEMNDFGRDSMFKMIHDKRVDEEVIAKELDKIEDINHVDNGGLSYLHAAVLYYRPNIVELLLKKGIKVDIADRRGNTPLMYAVGRKHPKAPEIFKLLLDYGANLDLMYGEQTIREAIIMFKDTELIEIMKNYS